MVLVPLAARDAAESLQKALNSVVSGGRRVGVDAPAVLVPSSFHDAADALPKRPNLALSEGFRLRRAPLMVPAPRRDALLPESLQKASI